MYIMEYVWVEPYLVRSRRLFGYLLSVWNVFDVLTILIMCSDAYIQSIIFYFSYKIIVSGGVFTYPIFSRQRRTSTGPVFFSCLLLLFVYVVLAVGGPFAPVDLEQRRPTTCWRSRESVGFRYGRTYFGDVIFWRTISCSRHISADR